MTKQVMWRFAIYAFFVFLSSTSIITGYTNQAQQGMYSQLERVNFHYVIFKNNLTNPNAPNDGLRNMYVLLDVDAFSEANLKELFNVISKAFPEPEILNVYVYTSVKQVYTPEYTYSQAPTPPEYYYYHRAFYGRGKESELFRYTLTPTSRELKTVILSGKGSF